MKNKFAGRAGEKLEFALDKFQINITGKTCADFGSAVGGFVDCLLKHGSAKIYAVETGYGVLDWELRNKPQVVVMERTNAMHVTLQKKVDLITIDTSWTKQQNIIPNALNNLKPNGMIVTLIKPHYESPQLLKHGKLDETDSETTAKQVVQQITDKFGLQLFHFIQSPVLGGKGKNTEYLAVLKRKPNHETNT